MRNGDFGKLPRLAQDGAAEREHVFVTGAVASFVHTLLYAGMGFYKRIFGLCAVLLFLGPQLVHAGCNTRSVTVAVQGANDSAYNAVASTFAQCTTCPCNVKATSEVQVLSQVAKPKLFLG